MAMSSRRYLQDDSRFVLCDLSIVAKVVFRTVCMCACVRASGFVSVKSENIDRQ